MRTSKTEYPSPSVFPSSRAMVRMYGMVCGPSPRPPMKTRAFLDEAPSSYAQESCVGDGKGCTRAEKGPGSGGADMLSLSFWRTRPGRNTPPSVIQSRYWKYHSSSGFTWSGVRCE